MICTLPKAAIAKFFKCIIKHFTYVKCFIIIYPYFEATEVRHVRKYEPAEIEIELNLLVLKVKFKMRKKRSKRKQKRK